MMSRLRFSEKSRPWMSRVKVPLLGLGWRVMLKDGVGGVVGLGQLGESMSWPSQLVLM